jgi:hypothetical protein
MFTIHARVKDGVVCVYALTARRTTRVYKEIFKKLNELAANHNLELNPEIIVSDFEMSSIQAAKQTYVTVESRGCYFHFRQAIFRKAAKLGIRKNYFKPAYSKYVNSFGALAHIPIEFITQALALIKLIMPKNDQSCQYLFDYFERTWIKNIDPQNWNQYNNCTFCTNNSVEGFHSKVNKLFCSDHPNIYNLIKILIKINDSALVKSRRLKLGQKIGRTNKKALSKSKQIEEIKLNFLNNSNDFNKFFNDLIDKITYDYSNLEFQNIDDICKCIHECSCTINQLEASTDITTAHNTTITIDDEDLDLPFLIVPGSAVCGRFIESIDSIQCYESSRVF